MVFRWLSRLLAGRRLSAASHAVEGVRAIAGGRRWSAIRLLAFAAVCYRWRAAGMVFELGRRLWHRTR